MNTSYLLLIFTYIIIILLVIGYNTSVDQEYKRKKQSIDLKAQRKLDIDSLITIKDEIIKKDEQSTELIKEFLKRESLSIKLSEEKNKFYETIIDNVISPIYVKNNKGYYILFNKSFSTFFKINKSDIELQKYGNNIDFMNSFFNDIDSYKNVFTDSSVFDFHETNSNIFKTNNNKVLQITKTYYQNISGESFLIGIVNDITDLVHKKESVDHEKNMLEMILDAIHLPIFVIDENYTIIKVNKIMCELLDKSKEDLLNKKYVCNELFQCGECIPCQIDEKHEIFEKVLVNGKIVDKKRFLIVVKKEFLLENAKYFVISILDKINE